MCDSNHIMEFLDLIKGNEKKLFEIVHYKKGQILFHEDDRCHGRRDTGKALFARTEAC